MTARGGIYDDHFGDGNPVEPTPMTDTRSDSLEGLEALRTKIERDSRGQFGPSMLDVVRMSGIYETEIQRLQAHLSTTEALLQQELGEAQVRIETDGRLIALLEGRITSTQDLLRRAEGVLKPFAVFEPTETIYGRQYMAQQSTRLTQENFRAARSLSEEIAKKIGADE